MGLSWFISRFLCGILASFDMKDTFHLVQDRINWLMFLDIIWMVFVARNYGSKATAMLHCLEFLWFVMRRKPCRPKLSSYIFKVCC